MKIERNDQDKLALFWLTKAEQENPLLLAQMKQELIAYKHQKYTVAVFYSGQRNLQDVTEGLLLHNQKVFAKRDLVQDQEIQTEQGQIMTM